MFRCDAAHGEKLRGEPDETPTGRVAIRSPDVLRDIFPHTTPVDRMNSGESTESTSDATTTAETAAMKTGTMMSGNSEELKIPYVLLERCSLEEINSYKPRTERNSYNEIDSTSEQLHSNSLNLLSYIGDHQRLFHSYVLLERLSPNVIQDLLSKKEE